MLNSSIVLFNIILFYITYLKYVPSLYLHNNNYISTFINYLFFFYRYLEVY